MLFKKKIVTAALAAFGLAAAANQCKANPISTLHLDINAVSISAVSSLGADAFSGKNFTGTLNFASTGSTNIGVDINGIQDTSYDGTVIGFSGSMDFINGQLNSGNPLDPDCGSITVTVQDTHGTDSYQYDIVSQSGMIAGNLSYLFGYRLSGTTENGEFANANFAGVDVYPWVEGEPLVGNFFQFNYHPNANGVDMNAQVEVKVFTPFAVPAPAAWAGGLMGMSVLAIATCFKNRKSRAL